MTSTCGSTVAPNIACWVATVIHVGVNTRIGLVHQVRIVWTSIGRAVRGASGTRSIAAVGGAHGGGGVVAIVHVRVDTRIEFVHEVGTVRTCVGGTMSVAGGASSIAAVRGPHGGGGVVPAIHVRVDSGISLVGKVGGVGTGSARGGCNNIRRGSVR
jgi:hypothetical protein